MVHFLLFASSFAGIIVDADDVGNDNNGNNNNFDNKVAADRDNKNEVGNGNGNNERINNNFHKFC